MINFSRNLHGTAIMQRHGEDEWVDRNELPKPVIRQGGVGSDRLGPVVGDRLLNLFIHGASNGGTVRRVPRA